MEKIGKNAFLQRSVHGRAHRQVIVFLLFLSLCSPAWALAVASGSVSAKAVVDQEGRINAIEVTAILYHDDDSCWDYVFAQGDWATLEYYLDGVHQGGLYSFQVRFGPGEPYDSRGKLITIDKKLGNLSRGRHTASFQMVDWYGGLSCLRGNVIAEALVFVNAMETILRSSMKRLTSGMPANREAAWWEILSMQEQAINSRRKRTPPFQSRVRL